MNSSNVDQRLTQFLDRIDEYIENKSLGASSFRKELKEAESFSYDELNNISQDDCFNYAFFMYGYADHINDERSRQENVIAFCEESINKIIAREYKEVQNIYASHDVKVAMITQENVPAQKLIQFKNVAESRIRSLKTKEFNIRRMAECLLEKGKRK